MKKIHILMLSVLLVFQTLLAPLSVLAEGESVPVTLGEEKPTEPGKPGEEKPTEPGKPGEEKPTEPGKPGEEKPTEPGKPGEEKPTEPGKPGEEKPTEPGKPGEEKPTEPGKPGEEKPTEPGKPGEEKPTEPGKPGEEKPTEPGKPGEEKPTEPGKPGEEKPTEPGKPGEEKPTEPGENEEEIDKPIAPGNKTGFHLVLDKATQGPNDEEFNTDNPLNPMNEFFVHYKWSLDDGHGYDAGDTVSFQLPKQLNILAAADGELADALGTVFANYYVATDGTVTFTFTKAVDNMSAIEGDFYIKSRLNPSQTEIEDGKVVIGPMAEGGHLDIPVNTGEMAANISKAGTPLPAFSPKEIEWTITVDSKMLKHKDGKVTDILPPGLTYKPSSITINGEQAAEPTIDGQNLNIALGEFTGTKTIKIITTIDDEHWDDALFANKATYEATGVDKIEAGVSVKIDRGEPLTKKGGHYNPVTQEMEWEIELNFNGRTVTNTTIQDSWTEGLMQLVHGSFEFYEVSIDDNGNATIVSKADVAHTINNSSTNGFDVGVSSIDKPYIVKYKTKLTDRLIEGQNISNGVKWNGNTSEGTVWAEQGVGYKGHSNVNYKNKTVDWYLVANTDNKEMTKFTINDTFGSGLTLKEDTFIVTVGGKTLTKGTDYTFTATDNGFTIQFIGAYETLNEAVEVKYTTDFDYTKLKPGENFTNNAKYTWYTEGKDTPWEKEVNDGFTPDGFTKHDGNKSGYYDARDKTITWTIGVNYQQNAHEELIVKDLIQGNQKLLPDTIKVSEGVLGGGNNSIWAGAEIADANVTKPEIDGKPGFSVNLGKTNKPYVITYKTSLEGLDYIETNYKNTANVFDGTTKLTDLPADVGITQGGKYGGKTGKQNGKAIDWTVTVNASQANVQDVVLTDTLSANQEFLQDTIKVYATTVDNSGTVTKGAAYNNVTINVTEEAPQTLTVKFNEPIDRPYIVEYSTLYFAGHNEIVSNDYKVTGSNIGDKGEQGSKESVTIDQSTGGSGSGKVGYLQVHKVASDDENKVFADIEFQLIDEKTGKVLKTGVTDKDGNIDFGRLMFGNYLVKEMKAPEGYLTPTEAYKVTINKEYIKGNPEKIGNIETIVNDKEIKQIEISKYEPGASWLAGAEFMIKNDEDEVVEENLVTDDNGKVTSKELPVGTYTLVETKAPQGYNKLTEPIEFTIEAGKAEPVVKDVPNVKLGDVLLEKKDKATGKVLAGVEFELQKKNAETGKFEKVGATLITDEHGVITVKDLENGDYQFMETKPLEGYKPLKNPITFTVGQKTRAALNFVVENEIDESSQKVIKVDADDETKRLAGAQFELYAEKDGERTLIPNGDKTYFTTDANGEIEFTQLDDGKYVFKEIKSPTGYEITQVEYNFKVGDGKVEPIIVTNKMKLVKLVTIELVKKDIVTGNPLAGAVFTLTNQDGSVKFENLDTDAEGKLTIENVPEGQYTLTETKRPEGYQSLPKPIVINVTHDSEALIEVEVPNAPLGHAQIMKVETGTINPIAGVTFKLEKYFNDAWKEIEQITTDENGLAFSEKLDYGKYRYVEIKAPNGVIVDSTPIEFEVNAKNYNKLEKVIENIYANPKVELLKLDSKGNTLAGAQFELYKVERTGEDKRIANGERTYFTTNEQGKIEAELEAAGDYYFVETKAPAGYILDKKPQRFTVDKGQLVQVEMTNEKLPIIISKGSVELVKVDAKDVDNVLAGATFKLIDKAGNTIKDNLVTNTEGKIKVTGLDAGDYYFVETKAPVGYELDTSKYLVQVASNTVAKVKVSNTKVVEGPPTPPGDKFGAVTLVKVDEQDAKKVLANAVFKLVDKAGITVKDNLVTDKTGKITVEDLAIGDYYFVETKAPTGYELDTTKHLVKIEEQVQAKITVTNIATPNQKVGTITLTKVDAKDASKVLAGATFQLLDENGSVVKDNLITDKYGKIAVEDLAIGDYYFVETKAPARYQLDTTNHLVQVDANKETIITITNRKRPTGGGGGGTPPPTNPEKPTEPGKPGEEKPTEPGKPGEEKPTEPGKPGEEKPTEPGKPGEEKPTEPGKPGEEKPTEPGKPGEEKPTEPGKPGEGKPTEPSDPNGGTTTTPGNPNGGTTTTPGNPNGGTTTTPGNPNGGTTTTPGNPNSGSTNPQLPGVGTSNGNANASNSTNDVAKLPQTDGKSTTYMIYIGLALMAFSVLVFIRRRKATQ